MVATAAAVALLIAIAAWWLPGEPQREAAVDAEVRTVVSEIGAGEATEHATTPQPLNARSAAAAANPPDPLLALRERFARSSLRGTEVDGAITLHADGSLVMDRELLRHFDYFLGLIGEFTLDEIRQLLIDETTRQAGGRAAASVADAFDRYVAMRKSLAEQAPSADLADQIERVRAVQRDWFGADAEAMFGDENRYVEDSVERLAIERDMTLSGAERDARLADLESTMPSSERSNFSEVTSGLLAGDQTRHFEALHTDVSARHAERAELWGTDAADRLAVLDQSRADWERRIAEYIAARDTIQADSQLGVASRQAAIIVLRQRLFDPNEQIRIESLESIGELRTGE